MNRLITALVLIGLYSPAMAQTTFKAGWNTCTTGSITREYTYSYAYKDSIKLYLTDSIQVFTSTDSLTILTLSFPYRDKNVYKTINYLNAKKLLVKTEDYKDDNMLASKEWRYDDKGRKIYSYEENKVSGNSYKKYMEYNADRKSGEVIISETAYFNGRVEFYTKTYINKKNVKYKEVRLNDNNKDVVHIESFIYGDDGNLKERSVYFPEWKVTRTFPEKQETLLPKCSRVLPVGIPDKVALGTRISYMKKVLLKNQAVFNDKECDHCSFTFKNFANCEIVLASTNVNNGKKVIFKYKEKP